MGEGGGRGWEDFLTTTLKLPQIWVIYIGKGGPKIFAQVTTILGHLYWKYYQLTKRYNEMPEIEVFLGSSLNFTTRVFTWSLANDLNLRQKYDKPANIPFCLI